MEEPNNWVMVIGVMREKLTDRYISKIQRSDAYPPQKRVVIYDTTLAGFCLIIQASGVMSFVLRYRRLPDGASREYALGRFGSIKASQARKLALIRSGEVRTGLDIQQMKKDAKAKAEREKLQTLSAFFEHRYKPYCLSEMVRGAERAWAIDHYFVSQWPDKPLVDVNKWLITNWRNQKVKEGLKPGGVNRPISALKAMLSRAVEWNVIELNPLANVKPLEEGSGVIRYLTDAEEVALRVALDKRQGKQRKERERYNEWRTDRHLESLPPLAGEYTDYLKPLVLLALGTGMRRGELFDLRQKSIDFNRRQITVHWKTTKNRRTRYIPLTEEGFHVLDRWCDQNCMGTDDLVFPSPVTKVRFNNINTAWRGLLKVSGIENFRFHDLRHTFASKLAMRGVNLYAIKELLGHASIETTQRYAHLGSDYLTAAIANLNRSGS